MRNASPTPALAPLAALLLGMCIAACAAGRAPQGPAASAPSAAPASPAPPPLEPPPPRGPPTRVPREYVVAIDTVGEGEHVLRYRLGRYGIERVQELRHNVFLVTFTKDPGLEPLEEHQRIDPRIASVEPNVVYGSASPTPPPTPSTPPPTSTPARP